jgi:hypothetical protein
MTKTIHWSDGTDWTADDATFERVTECLGAVRDVIWGSEPILARLQELVRTTGTADVDAFAPSEEDRAVVTAALERAVEHAKRVGASGLGFEEPRDFTAFLSQLEQLHRLFVTDITHELPRGKKR